MRSRSVPPPPPPPVPHPCPLPTSDEPHTHSWIWTSTCFGIHTLLPVAPPRCGARLLSLPQPAATAPIAVWARVAKADRRLFRRVRSLPIGVELPAVCTLYPFFRPGVGLDARRPPSDTTRQNESCAPRPPCLYTITADSSPPAPPSGLLLASPSCVCVLGVACCAAPAAQPPGGTGWRRPLGGTGWRRPPGGNG